jgi:hypothetical protein
LAEISNLLKTTVAEHAGVELTVEVASPAVPLEADVEGFETTVVSYFTVNSFITPPFDPQDAANLDGEFTRYLYGPGRYFSSLLIIMLLICTAFYQLTGLMKVSRKRTY